MLDINLFRVDKGGNPDVLKASQRKRGHPESIIDTVIEQDRTWVGLRFEVDAANKEANRLQQQIAELIKSKQDATALVDQRKAVLEGKKMKEQEMENLEQQIKHTLQHLGNVVHDSVPVSMDEENNSVVRTHNSDVLPKTLPSWAKSHHQVLARLDGYDGERGAKVSGHRGYFLKGIGVRLNQALINYGLDFLSSRKYTPIQTPFFMRKSMMAKCAQLEDFDEQLYKIVDSSSSNNPSSTNPSSNINKKVEQEEEGEKYLIATSEQPLAAMHADEWFEEPKKQLPVWYAGYSTCFRKEAGSHGKDTWGLFRIHQFEKVEQFVICEPELSWQEHERMIQVAEEFYQSLGLNYQVISLVSGALNLAAAKKYDLEAWFPVQQRYRELVSCSNCTDYQSRRLEIRCGQRKLGDREKRYVHCLNGTLVATERTLCCLLENYQTEHGIVIPTVLRPYLGNADFIPFPDTIANDADGVNQEGMNPTNAEPKLEKLTI